VAYKLIPISNEISKEVRETLVSPQYKHPASVSMATGYGPCRSCLRTFDAGKEERILFTYNSFDGLSYLPLPGPVFVHAEKCEAYGDPYFPPDLIDLPLLFEGFGDNSELMTRENVDKARIDDQIEEILELDKVRFINIRNAEAGCFIARIDRDGFEQEEPGNG
jgi:hypothetical protein